MVIQFIYCLCDQAETNPLMYTSHGSDHSLRVMKVVEDLMKVLQKQISLFYEDIPWDHLLIFTAIMGLLDDVGYTQMAYCFEGKPSTVQEREDKDKMVTCGKNKGIQAKYKFVHAEGSKREIERRGIPLLLLELFGSKNQNVIQDIMFAIEHHNDDNIHHYKDNNNQGNNVFVADQYHFTNLFPEGTVLKRAFVPADLYERPFLFLLRIADNCDFCRNRLTLLQQDLRLIDIQQMLYQHPSLQNPQSPFHQDSLRLIRQEILSQSQFQDPPLLEEQKQIIDQLDETEFLFNYSNWIVDQTDFLWQDSKVLKIQFIQTVPSHLSPHLNSYAALFQISRFAQSAQSLFILGQPFFRSSSSSTYSFSSIF